MADILGPKGLSMLAAVRRGTIDDVLEEKLEKWKTQLDLNRDVNIWLNDNCDAQDRAEYSNIRDKDEKFNFMKRIAKKAGVPLPKMFKGTK